MANDISNKAYAKIICSFEFFYIIRLTCAFPILSLAEIIVEFILAYYVPYNESDRNISIN